LIFADLDRGCDHNRAPRPAVAGYRTASPFS
jgi:hypothetical protein